MREFRTARQVSMQPAWPPEADTPIRLELSPPPIKVWSSRCLTKAISVTDKAAKLA